MSSRLNHATCVRVPTLLTLILFQLCIRCPLPRHVYALFFRIICSLVFHIIIYRFEMQRTNWPARSKMYVFHQSPGLMYNLSIYRSQTENGASKRFPKIRLVMRRIVPKRFIMVKFRHCVLRSQRPMFITFSSVINRFRTSIASTRMSF